MKNNQIIKKLLGGWEYTRCQTYELLDSLKDEDLDFTPEGNSKFLDLQYQFACMGSTQLAFTKMVKERKYTNKYFSVLKSPLKRIRKTSSLKKKLKEIDKEFKETIIKFSDDSLFDWGDIKTPAWRIITFLQEHERLHHGQLISYFTLAKLKFPPGFRKTWSL